MIVRFMRWSRRKAAAFILLFCTLVSFAAAPASGSEAAASLVHKKKYVMGTVFEIVAYDASPKHASDAINRAFEKIVQLDESMSNYKSDSALSRLNRSAHFHAEVVPHDLYRVIDESLLYSRLSGGKFDISVAPLVNLWKAAMRGEHVPSSGEQARLRRCVGYQNIALFPPDRIEFRSPCLQVDLGAIGKGYAVDRA